MYTYIPISLPSCISLPPTLPTPPLQVVTKHRADLPVLCGCFPLASYFTFGSVCISMPLSHFVPAYPSASLYPQVHSLVGLHVYSRLTPRFFMTIFFVCFLDSIYMCQHTVFVFLFLTYFILYDRTSRSTSLQITQFHIFLWLSNIPLYICAPSSLSIPLLMDTQVVSMSWLL